MEVASPRWEVPRASASREGTENCMVWFGHRQPGAQS
jgi:hypothetical protein